MQHAELIAVIQRRGRLVHQKNFCLLRQRASDQHELLLTAGELLKIASCEVLNAELLHRLYGNLTFAAAGGGKGGQPVVGTHQDHVQRGVGKNRVVKLRNEGDAPRQLLRGESGDVLPVEQNPAAVAVQQAEHTAEQRRLARAVRAEEEDQLLLPGPKGNTPQHLPRTVGKLQILHFQHQWTPTFRSIM